MSLHGVGTTGASVVLMGALGKVRLESCCSRGLWMIGLGVVESGIAESDQIRRDWIDHYLGFYWMHNKDNWGFYEGFLIVRMGFSKDWEL